LISKNWCGGFVAVSLPNLEGYFKGGRISPPLFYIFKKIPKNAKNFQIQRKKERE